MVTASERAFTESLRAARNRQHSADDSIGNYAPVAADRLPVPDARRRDRPGWRGGRVEEQVKPVARAASFGCIPRAGRAAISERCRRVGSSKGVIAI